jgi:Protein of unknown function (DUF2442)
MVWAGACTFHRVDPEAATVVWPNGADLAPETLYKEARKNPLIAA